MPAFAEILDALYDLLNADNTFKGHVSKHDFGKVSDTGDIAAVLRVGSFRNTEDSFGGTYALIWTVLVDLYYPYSQQAEEDVEQLVVARDTVVDLIQQNIYLGKGAGNAQGIQAASVTRGGALEFVISETDTVTHFSLTVEIEVYQTRTVAME